MTTGKALAIARAYVEAITNKDVEPILSISADDVVCTSPMGQTTGLGSNIDGKGLVAMD